MNIRERVMARVASQFGGHTLGRTAQPIQAGWWRLIDMEVTCTHAGLLSLSRAQHLRRRSCP